MGLQSRLPGWGTSRPEDAIVGKASPTDLLAREALAALGARLVNISRLDRLTNRITGLAWAWSTDGAYQRALAAVQRVVPGLEPSRHPVSLTANPALEAVHVQGRAVMVPFDEIASGTIHPWVIRVARVLMGLEWTISVPILANGRIAGSFAAHFSRRPTDEHSRLAQSYADELTRLLAVPAGSTATAPLTAPH